VEILIQFFAFPCMTGLQVGRSCRTRIAQTQSVKDLVDERFRQKEEQALRDIDAEFLNKSMKAESTLQSRMNDLMTSITADERSAILRPGTLTDLSSFIDAQLDCLAARLDTFLDNGGPSTYPPNPAGGSCMERIHDLLSQSECDLSVFEELTHDELVRNLDLSGTVSTPSESLSSKAGTAMTTSLESIYSALDQLETTHSTPSYTISLSSSLPPVALPRFLAHSTSDPLADEIHRLQEVVRKLARHPNPGRQVETVLADIDSKYLKMIAEISNLIFQAIEGSHQRIDPLVCNKVLPVALSQDATLMNQLSHGIAAYLGGNSHDKKVERLVQFEMNRISRLRR